MDREIKMLFPKKQRNLYTIKYLGSQQNRVISTHQKNYDKHNKYVKTWYLQTNLFSLLHPNSSPIKSATLGKTDSVTRTSKKESRKRRAIISVRVQAYS